MSDGGCRVVVIPDECSSFQYRFDGCAYTNPVLPVNIPGFTPTRSSVRWAGIVSRRRDEEAGGEALAGGGFRRRRVGVGFGEDEVEDGVVVVGLERVVRGGRLLLLFFLRFRVGFESESGFDLVIVASFCSSSRERGLCFDSNPDPEPDTEPDPDSESTPGPSVCGIVEPCVETLVFESCVLPPFTFFDVWKY